MSPRSILLASLSLVALVACNGGGDSGALPTNRVQTFPDGSGTAVGTIEVDGEAIVYVAFSSDASEFDEVDATSPADQVPFNLNDLVYAGSNAYGDFFRVAGTYEGVNYEAVVYQEYADGSVLILGQGEDGYQIALAEALALTDLPTSGVAYYYGTNVIGSRDGVLAEDGTFTLVADFDAAKVALNGSTPSTNITASGVPLTGANGTFSTFDGTLTVNGASEPASVVGSFTGVGAYGVSGIYLDNTGDGPDYVGAFDG